MTRRATKTLTEGWQFRMEEVRSGQAHLRPELLTWRKVRIPHSWNGQDMVDFTPGYLRGVGVYRRSLVWPDPELGAAAGERRVFVEFDGVNQVGRVRLNGKLLGEHRGGYTRFSFEIGELLREGENILEVRADNSLNYDVPPVFPTAFHQETWPGTNVDLVPFFGIHGGIYREVRLRITPPCRIVRQLWTTVPGDRTNGRVAVRVKLRAEVEIQSGGYALRAELRDREGQLVAQAAREMGDTGEADEAGHGTAAPVEMTLEVPDARLWSPEHPHLYTARVLLMRGDTLIDEAIERVGLRWLRFTDQGLILNGSRVKLHGTNRHQEWGAADVALSATQHLQDLRMIKEAGWNMVRLAHYPQDDTVLERCDELGLVVWEEIPWVGGGVGGERFKENVRTMLREMILQHYNHPSICFWGLGNEQNSYQRAGSTDEKCRRFLAELNDRAHRMDPSRLTVSRKFGQGVTDVFSPSIWAGWYHDADYRTLERRYDQWRRRAGRFLHGEWGAEFHRGRHDEAFGRRGSAGDMRVAGGGPEALEERTELMATADGARGDAGAGDAGPRGQAREAVQRGSQEWWDETYANELVEWHVRIAVDCPWLAGNIQWCFADFCDMGYTNPPYNPLPNMNCKGVVDALRRPKDAYFVIQSRLKTDAPVLYLESHTWPVRTGANPRPVRVYSNLAEVELLHNGKSLGARRRQWERFPAQGLIWSVTMAEGENVLEARGMWHGEVVRDRITFRYRSAQAGPPARIICRCETKPVRPGQQVWMSAEVVDDNGLRCLSSRNEIRWHLESGCSRLLCNDGTVNGGRVVQAVNGVARIRVEVGNDERTLRVRAESPGLEPHTVVLRLPAANG